ncbi:hypothetical protein [Dyella kyungheensis]|uniref:Uncharacterized protein n=1 Tax=Dyella kyungheensis TaxID=1242174 RepID=A0ABS2JW60_9GAMM|nr:hypothetical protein [Dyella kyungheensis]MBM7123099.1 hypothetical protein [Dyella kyungheensis]
MNSSIDNAADFRNIWPLSAAVWTLAFAALAPIFFTVDWLFHIFPDRYPVIHRMHGLGPEPKILWVASGAIAMVAIYYLTRHPVLGLLACCAFAALYVPAAIVLWGQFTWGCWLALLVVALACCGAFMASRVGRDQASNKG